MSPIGDTVAVAAALCFAAADGIMQAELRKPVAERPEQLNQRVVGELAGCLAASAVEAPAWRSAGCYDQTLWASSVFLSRRGGVSRERARRGYPAEVATLVDAVYAAQSSEAEFRRDWFVACLGGR